MQSQHNLTPRMVPHHNVLQFVDGGDPGTAVAHGSGRRVEADVLELGQLIKRGWSFFDIELLRWIASEIVEAGLLGQMAVEAAREGNGAFLLVAVVLGRRGGGEGAGGKF